MRDTNTGTPISLSPIPVAWARVSDSPKVRKKPSRFGWKAICWRMKNAKDLYASWTSVGECFAFGGTEGEEEEEEEG